jgi:hypothetical protein
VLLTLPREPAGRENPKGPKATGYDTAPSGSAFFGATTLCKRRHLQQNLPHVLGARELAECRCDISKRVGKPLQGKDTPPLQQRGQLAKGRLDDLHV